MGKAAPVLARLMRGTALGGTLLAASSIAATASEALAQPEPNTATRTQNNGLQAAHSRPAPIHVEDIVVHAQRTAEPLQKVPVSVAVVSGAELTRRRLNELSQITVTTPSLTVGQAGFYSIRGIGSLTQNSILDSSVGVSVDEISLGVPGLMSNGILDDVAQIEVLNGPQGLLFGRNASAGLINILSNKPILGKFEGYGSVEYDDRDTAPGGQFGLIGRATINIPVSETSALRVNVSQSYQDPVTKTVNPDPLGVRRDNPQNDTSLRAKYLWQPSSNFSAYLIGDYSRLRGIAGSPYQEITYRSRSGPPGTGEAVGLAKDGITPGPDNLLAGANGAVFSDIDTGGVSLNLAYVASPALTISNIAAWRHFRSNLQFDFDFSSASFLDRYHSFDDYSQYSDEFRLAFRPNELLDGQTGFYAFYSDQTGGQDLVGSGLSAQPNLVGSDSLFHVKNLSLAAYSQVNIHLNDQLRLVAGGRVSNDNVSIDLKQNFGNYRIKLLGPSQAVLHQNFKDIVFSFKFGPQYQFRPDLMVYATISSGYKGPSFNQLEAFAGQNLAVRPEISRSLEAGLKATLFDRRLTLNVSGFDEDFRDLQVENFEVVGSNSTYVNGNAGRARTVGVEMSGVARPIRGLTVNLGTTIQDAHFTDYPGAPCYLGQTGFSSCLQPARSFNAAGTALPNSAKFIGSLEAIYEFPMGPDWSGYVEGNFYYRSSINYSASGAPQTKFGDVDTLGLSVGARLYSGLELSLFCKDCTDQRIPTSLLFDTIDQGFAQAITVQQTWSYNSVRTVGVAASLKF